MNGHLLRFVAAGLLLAGAAPVLAQPPAPPTSDGGGQGNQGRPGRGGHMGDRAFASLSEEGRMIMRDAMHGGRDRKAERDAVKAAREHVLAVLDADRLDTGALKRAMDDERGIVNADRERTQMAMQAAFAKLSLADRKAFVAEARSMKDRMEARVQRWRDNGGKRGGWGRRGAGGPDDGPDAPPPPGGF